METMEKAWKAFEEQVEEAVFEPWATSLTDHARALAVASAEKAVDAVLADLERAVASPQKFRAGDIGGTQYAALLAEIERLGE